MIQKSVEKWMIQTLQYLMIVVIIHLSKLVFQYFSTLLIVDTIITTLYRSFTLVNETTNISFHNFGNIDSINFAIIYLAKKNSLLFQNKVINVNTQRIAERL